MIHPCRTYSHHDLKKIIKQSNKPTTKPKQNRKAINNQNYHQMEAYVQTIRSHQLKILELRNELLKKQIQTKEKSQQLKDMEKQIVSLRKDKDIFGKNKEKFELQRKARVKKISDLEEENEQLRQKLERFQAPKDRYQTCMRELDELKINMQTNQDIVKERDLYKYFYDEMQELVLSSVYSAEEVRSSLKSFFLEVNEKMQPSKYQSNKTDIKLFSK